MTLLTDLEGATLAEIAARGTATSYLIAQVFAKSPSEYWSGSAGAVYPLIKRLSERGLLEPSAAASGKRQRIDYQITPLGRDSLENWLLDAKRASGMGFDPLRTRLGHLHLVPESKREAFLREVRSHFEEFAKRPSFEGQPKMIQTHQSWLRARAAWLSMLDFVIK
jgi:DNA-binding PadR family transcriptional regulator